jgi:hypothetical protein
MNTEARRSGYNKQYGEKIKYGPFSEGRKHFSTLA